MSNSNFGGQSPARVPFDNLPFIVKLAFFFIPVVALLAFTGNDGGQEITVRPVSAHEVDHVTLLPAVVSAELPTEVPSVMSTVTAEEADTQEAPQEAECRVSKNFPKKVRRWCEIITRHAEKNGLPPDLIAALILQESGGNPDAYSHSGAVGLMQVMPRDGIAASFGVFGDRPTIKELKDPNFNVKWGTKFLKNLLKKKNGDYREALKSYGPMDVGYSYADKVLALYKKYGKRPGE